MNEIKAEKSKQTNGFKRFVIKNTTVLIIVFGFIFIAGLAWYIFLTFKDETKDQNIILTEIRNSQKSIEDLEEKLSEQQETIQELTNNVCILQEQIVSLGATPRVQDSNCQEILPK